MIVRKSVSIIESLGVYLPPKVVSTHDVVRACKNKIVFPLEALTGIENRRVAGETEFAIDLAKQAVRACLARSKYTPQDIDLVICCNISRYDGPRTFSFEPSTSLKLKKYFGFDRALAFDLTNACAGMFTAIALADVFIAAGLIRCSLVVSGEYITHLTQTAQKEIDSLLDQRMACLTLGDAGAALILEKSPDEQVGFHAIDLYTLGRYSSYCIAKATDQEHGGAIMFTDSIRLVAAATKHAIQHSASVMEAYGWSPKAFQHLVMHQTSQTSINAAVRELNHFFRENIYHKGNTINNLAQRGNTASTSHFVAVMDNILNGRIKSGDNVLFSVTASGITIGTALYTFDDLPDRLRRAESKPPATPRLGMEGTLRPAPNGRSRTPRVRIESIGLILDRQTVTPDTVTLVKVAAEACLKKSSHDRSDIGLLVYSGVYRNDFISEPAMAALIAGELRLNDAITLPAENKTLAFDLLNGSLGFLNACYVASQVIQAKMYQSALIVTSEIENNAKVAPARLLGLKETGSAVLLDMTADGRVGFGGFVFKSFTDYLDDFVSATNYHDGKVYLQFDKAAELEEHYLACIQDAVQELLSSEGLELSQISVIFPPQISSVFIAKLSTTLEVAQSKLVDVTQPGADLYTSSLAYTWQHANDRRLVMPGDIGLIINVGSGIQVGGAIYYF